MSLPVPGAFRRIADPERAAHYRSEGWWGDLALTDHVRGHVRDRPSAPAFIAGGATLNWQEYDARSSELAAVFMELFDPGEPVAILLPDGAAVHVAFLAAEKAGVTIVGIGSRAGDRELRHLLGRTRAVALVSHGEHRGREMAEVVAELRRDGVVLRHHVTVPVLETAPSAEVLVDGDLATPTPDADAVDRRRLGPDDLFMLNSTSGTTGLPKCVMHTENRWFYFHQQAAANGRLEGSDVFLSIVPAPFGFGLWTAHFTPTVLGAPAIVMPRFDPASALELIERHRVTVLSCVSTQFIMMLNSPDADSRDLTSLRAMFTGGEAVPYQKARAFEERTGGRVLQFFGSNETGLLSGTTLEDPPDKRLRTAGRIVPEMQVRLFDRGRDVTRSGRGQPGCHGPAMTVGYYDDEDANRELFTTDGWMLMADICDLDDQGYLTVTGRLTDIIIRGGKNISAAQVEDEVATHPAVALAAAVAMPDPVFGERVCVFAEMRPGARLTLEELTAHLAARGTSKEIYPEELVVVEALPRASGGKVAKGELRATARERADRAQSRPESRTP